jgi:hypothetical protein
MTSANGIRYRGRRTSLVCCLRMTRLENRRTNRRDSPTPDGGNYSSEDGWSIAGWFGGDNSALRPTAAEAIAAAATVAAISALLPEDTGRHLIWRNRYDLDSF